MLQRLRDNEERRGAVAVWRESPRMCSTFRYSIGGAKGRVTAGADDAVMGEFDYCDTPQSPVFRGALGEQTP